jgi:hypothetical protein
VPISVNVRKDFSGVRESIFSQLREDQLPIHQNLEGAFTPHLQSNLRTRVLLLDELRQTGGPGVVVSNLTIVDFDLGHGFPAG